MERMHIVVARISVANAAKFKKRWDDTYRLDVFRVQSMIVRVNDEVLQASQNLLGERIILLSFFVSIWTWSNEMFAADDVIQFKFCQHCTRV